MNFFVENTTSEAETMLCNDDADLAQYSRVRAQHANRLVPPVRVTGKQLASMLASTGVSGSLRSESEVVSGPQSSEGLLESPRSGCDTAATG